MCGWPFRRVPPAAAGVQRPLFSHVFPFEKAGREVGESAGVMAGRFGVLLDVRDSARSFRVNMGEQSSGDSHEAES